MMRMMIILVVLLLIINTSKGINVNNIIRGNDNINISNYVEN